ncbi:MAG: hypothetical protein PVF43_09200, partial [Candidatus Eiseniibacteriota bacterium]
SCASRARALEIDQHEIGVAAQSIEHDLRASRCTVEGPHLGGILQPRQSATLARRNFACGFVRVSAGS